MPRHIVDSDQFAPNAVALSWVSKLLLFTVLILHPRSSAQCGSAAPARKGIVLAAFSFRARFANRQIAAMVRHACQCGNRRLALVAVSPCYKNESAGPAAHAIGHHLHISHGSIRREQIAQLVFGGGE